MGFAGTKVWQLVLTGYLAFVPFAFGDVTKGEFKGALPGSSPPKKSQPSSPKRKTYPFHGKVGSINVSKNLLIMDGKKQRSIRVDGGTKISREGLTVSLGSGKPGDRVTGSVTRDDLGQELAVSIKFSGSESSGVVNESKSSKDPK